MEIFEVIVAIVGAVLEGGEACGCIVQLLAGILDVSTAFTGVKAVKETKKRKLLRAEGETPAGPNTKWIAFWILLPFALFATGLAVATLVAALRR